MLTEHQILDPIYDALVATNSRRDWDGFIHVSDLHRCPMEWYRAQHLEQLGMCKKEPSPSEAAVFMRGNAFHKEMQHTLSAFGVLCAREKFVKHRVLPVCGSIDAIVSNPHSERPVVYELKSMDPDKFRMLGDEPYPEHALQAMMYTFLFNFGVNKHGQENTVLLPSDKLGLNPINQVSEQCAVVYFNTQYSIFKAYPVKFRMDVILLVVEKVKHYLDRLEYGPPTLFLKCDDANKKCGNCRLNKRLLKEGINV